MSDSVGRGLKCQDGQEALSALAEMVSSDLWLLGSRQSWQFRLQTIQLRSRGTQAPSYSGEGTPP